MKYTIRMSTQFKKDLKLCQKQNKDIDLLFSVIERISNGELLYDLHEHRLTGNYKNCFECHLASDWLLVWKVYEEEKIIYLNRLGTHSELFN